MINLLMKFLFFTVFSFYAYASFGSSCCISQGSIPSLMTLPGKIQVSTFGTYSWVKGDVDPDGNAVFRNDENVDQSYILRTNISYQRKNFQGGLGVRGVNRYRRLGNQKRSFSGVGDVSINFAYRFDKVFYKFYPYIAHTFPTARSLYDAKEELGVDAISTGLQQTNIGLLSQKFFKEGDLQAIVEVQQFWGRKFDATKVESHQGVSFLAGGGYVPWRSQMRFGVLIGPRYLDNASADSKGSLVWESLLSLSKQVSLGQTLSFLYGDQTIFGPTYNAQLSRTMSFNYQVLFY